MCPRKPQEEKKDKPLKVREVRTVETEAAGEITGVRGLWSGASTASGVLSETSMTDHETPMDT